jgi:hypothetical protein
VGEDLAQLVVGDLAHEGALAAEAGQARDGVGRRAAGGLHAGAILAIERRRLAGSTSIIAPLVRPFSARKASVAGRDHVDDGVADGATS